MQSLIITELEAGQRLDKFLTKYMDAAPKSFFYKMMRKKNITLNGKKCEGNERIASGDEIKLFLSEETIKGFQTVYQENNQTITNPELSVLYEDSNILVLNKPAGILSQKAEKNDISINEQVISYLLNSNQLSREQLKTFKPAVCNRLDRNTSGIVLAGKTLMGLQELSKALHDRTIHKYYRCVVYGEIKESMTVDGYLWKNPSNNQVTVHKEKAAFGNYAEEAKYIKTRYIPLVSTAEYTCLEVELITGRTHQIRSHLAYLGHPILGDTKYGDVQINKLYRKKYGITHQLLHAYRIVFPKTEGILKPLSGKELTAPLPPAFTPFTS